MDLDTLGDRLRRVTVEVMNSGSVVGAGVVWAPGWVVTNAHVVPQSRVMVRLPDDRRAEGSMVARDPAVDLAVLRVPGMGLPAATSAESAMVRVGSLVIAIGHPFGMRGALAMGIVHAVGPVAPAGRPWIQADLRLAPGNSGGPLADARGRLLGLNAMIVGNLALAIPVGEVRRFAGAAGVPLA